MIKRIVVILALALLFAAFEGVPARAEFEDVPGGHWAYDAVTFMEENGFLLGYPDGTFQGDRVLTRYEFAMVVSRLYTEFLDMVENNNEPTVDQQAVMEKLMNEFQPDIDRLKDLIDINTTRIGIVEGTADQLNTKLNDLTKRIDGLNPAGGFNPSGDLRVRFEGVYPSSGLQTQRPRYRLRWGFTQSITPELFFGARLASGSTGAITSTNETIDDAFGIDPINIDRAFLQYSPASVPDLKLWAGKFAPPWKNTPLVWDSDTMVEGISQQYTHGDFQVTLGELVPTTKGFYLVAQAGANNLGVEGLSAYATYHWINKEAWSVISSNMQIKDSKDPNMLKSNWAWNRLDNPSDYRAVEGYLQYKANVGSTPLTFSTDYLQNMAGAAQPAEGEEALSSWTKAAWAELAIMNTPADIGDWQFKGEWGRAQANSVLTWLADADRGGSDWQWWAASYTYRLLKNTDLAIAYFDKDRLSKDASERILQADVVTKF